jgi:AcrR family transcriptional regulator
LVKGDVIKLDDKAPTKGQSFIADARRTQIMNAAVTTLDEIGYVNASLAQIAKRAGISTALISYHFEDKLDLMNHTLMALLENATTFVQTRIQPADSNQAKLHTYISASLDYQAAYPERFNALLEIIFNARTPDNVPYYKLEDDEEEPLLLELQHILRLGQENGEFRQFNVLVMANAIQGAIREYAGNIILTIKITAAAYGEELVRLFDKTVLS